MSSESAIRNPPSEILLRPVQFIKGVGPRRANLLERLGLRTVDDLLHLVQRRRADIGRTTVYRTLKLLQSAGLAQELELRGESRFEREYNRAHHDHFICQACGEIFEFASAEIERIQDEIAADLGFVIEGHRHQIFGQCRSCAGRPQRAEARR